MLEMVKYRARLTHPNPGMITHKVQVDTSSEPAFLWHVVTCAQRYGGPCGVIVQVILT